MKTNQMKILCLGISLFLSNTCLANSLSGIYHEPNCQPEGCDNIVLSNAHQAAALGFGYIMIGTWEQKDHEVIIHWHQRSSPFVLQGKNQDQLLQKNKVVWNFSGLGHAPRTLVAFVPKSAKNADIWQPVFNSGANCVESNYPKEISGDTQVWLWHSNSDNPEVGTVYQYSANTQWNTYDTSYDTYAEYKSKPVVLTILKNTLARYRPLVKSPLDKELTEMFSGLLDPAKKSKDSNADELVEMIRSYTYGSKDELIPTIVNNYNKPTNVKSNSIFSAQCEAKLSND